jgi:nitrate/nitrite transporter NarK
MEGIDKGVALGLGTVGTAVAVLVGLVVASTTGEGITVTVGVPVGSAVSVTPIVAVIVTPTTRVTSIGSAGTHPTNHNNAIVLNQKTT